MKWNKPNTYPDELQPFQLFLRMGMLKAYLRYLSFFDFNPLLGLLALTDEVRGERKYGLHTTGFEKVEKQGLKGPAAFDAFSYMPSNYILLERLFKKLHSLPHNGTFLDIGCGKGRVLLVAAHFGFTSISGTDVVEAYCREAEAMLRRKASLFPQTFFSVTCTDAANIPIPHTLQTIFFYNPFKVVVMERVLAQILLSCRQAPRTIYVIYLNPLFKDLFLDAGFREIYQTKRFGYMEGLLMQLDPS